MHQACHFLKKHVKPIITSPTLTRSLEFIGTRYDFVKTQLGRAKAALGDHTVHETGHHRTDLIETRLELVCTQGPRGNSRDNKAFQGVKATLDMAILATREFLNDDK